MNTKTLHKEKGKLEKAAYILKTIAHPTRLAAISLLESHKRLTVTDLSDLLECEQSLLSHHLTNMRLKGLLKAEKEGLHVYYSLKERNLIPLMSCIAKCDCQM